MNTLMPGDTIGIISPSWVAEKKITRNMQKAFLTCIGQSQLMEQITGLLFGHYSDEASPLLFEVLERFGGKYKIPIAYCDDFGHGVNHAIFPIGREAVLDTGNKTLYFR